MANLETLELTISANAQAATAGIGSLTRSLSALSAAVGKSVGGLMRLNAELKTLKGYGALKLPNLNKGTGTSKAVSGIKKATEYVSHGVNVDAVNRASPDAKDPVRWQKEYEENVAKSLAAHEARIKQNAEFRARVKSEAEEAARQAKQEQIAKEEYARVSRQASMDAVKAERAAMDVRGQETKDIIELSSQLDLLRLKYDAMKMETISMAKEGKLSSRQIAERGLQLQKLQSEIDKLNQKMSETKETAQATGESAKESIGKMAEPIKKVTSSAKGLLSTIGRIFKTMLIRTAIRALLKAAKEGLDNYYNYSKKMGGAFGSAMDKIANKWTQIKNQTGAALGGALTAILPILNAISTAALAALNAITALFALLTGKSTYSKATEGVEGYTSAVKGAGGAAKEWLATFDELNVMTSGGGGGGGGGADFGSMFTETELPAWMNEWKPIIEAVLGGVLGALILPKIFDWVKKIFGLFGTGAAAKAAELLTGLSGLGSLPSMGVLAGEMAAFAAAAAAAAAALPTITGELTAIVAVLTGAGLLSAVGSLLSLFALMAAGNKSVKFDVDRDDYDLFKKEFDEWKPKKTIGIVIDNEVVKVMQINEWVSRDDTKHIFVAVEWDIARITQINMWASTDMTKTVNVAIEWDVAKITQISMWLAKDDTKTVDVVADFKIDPDLSGMAYIDEWVKDIGIKYVRVKIDNDSAGMAEFDDFIVTVPAKYISVKIVDDNQVLGHLTDWINTVDTKVIDVKLNFNGNGSGSTGGVSGTGSDGSNWWHDFFFTPVWDLDEQWWNDFIKKPIWELGQNSDPIEVDIDNVVAIVDTKGFQDASRELLRDSVTGAFSPSKIKAMKKQFPRIEAKGIFQIANYDELMEQEKGELIMALCDAFGSAEAIASIKRSIPNLKATDIIKVVDWKKLTLNQKLEFLNALKSAFGASEAIAAAKAAGINIGELVEEGMASKDAAIQAQAHEWAELIKEGTESKPPVINPSLKDGSVKDMENQITKGIEGLKPVVTATAKYAKGYPDNLKTDAENQKPTVSANAGFGSGQLSGLKNDVEKLKPKITIGAEKGSGFDSTVNSIISSLKTALTRTISVSINNVDSMKVKLAAKANGGFVNSGDIFLANENGVPEMIGRFGNQTGVANQQQIIAGISSGVSAANAEQNALLRRQNEILLGILEKEMTVKFGASSAFGRTAQQSLDMYHKATGVNA